MAERTGVVSFKGNPMTLVGEELKVGAIAPQFRLLDATLSPVTLADADFKGKVKIVSTVPSLDTPVCDIETRRFNQEAVALTGSDLVVLTVSLDLPFAQKRWCGAAGVDRVIVASDYMDRAFGEAYGVLIKELKLLARAVFVIDQGNVVRYVQIVPEIGKEPDYAAALEVAKGLL